ncbi:MAG: hypothetical protein ACTH3D_06480 [Halomonas sp.]|uniref:hypothetical protein n=1 Tax=Halomonas sp. TaxID=1486246 RepID=UPI003F91105A
MLADLTQLRWSVIGHLQTSKAKHVARFASEFQASTALRIAAALERRFEIEEGATVVRVGQATFGPRPPPGSHYWPDADQNTSRG